MDVQMLPQAYSYSSAAGIASSETTVETTSQARESEAATTSSEEGKGEQVDETV